MVKPHNLQTTCAKPALCHLGYWALTSCWLNLVEVDNRCRFILHNFIRTNLYNNTGLGWFWWGKLNNLIIDYAIKIFCKVTSSATKFQCFQNLKMMMWNIYANIWFCFWVMTYMKIWIGSQQFTRMIFGQYPCLLMCTQISPLSYKSYVHLGLQLLHDTFIIVPEVQ
jgi:hypothetical protein